jgi:hypothetical protein
MAGAHAAGRGSTKLDHGAIGLREVMFQSITSMAPGGRVPRRLGLRAGRGPDRPPLVLGIAAFRPAWFTAMGIGGSVLKFVSPLQYPSSETGLATGIWYIVGVGVLIYLYMRHPSRLPEPKRVFADEEPAAVPAGRS